jgi:hypothetical protein
MKKTTATLAAGTLWLVSSAGLAAEDHLTIQFVEVERKAAKPNGGEINLKISVQGAVPMDGKAGAFGYAVLTDQGNNALVLVTHLPIDDSSHEDPKSGFHTHVLDLKAPGPACPGATFEVDLENSKKNAAFDADYRWKIKGSDIRIEAVPTADLGDAGVEGVAAFILKPVLNAKKAPTNLCVTVTDQI